MSRCKTGWRIFYDPDVAPWANAWAATHERGITHYRATWRAAKDAVIKETLREWERVDGVWIQRKAVHI